MHGPCCGIALVVVRSLYDGVASAVNQSSDNVTAANHRWTCCLSCENVGTQRIEPERVANSYRCMTRCRWWLQR